jgi:hypothetical protein
MTRLWVIAAAVVAVAALGVVGFVLLEREREPELQRGLPEEAQPMPEVRPASSHLSRG